MILYVDTDDGKEEEEMGTDTENVEEEADILGLIFHEHKDTTKIIIRYFYTGYKLKRQSWTFQLQPVDDTKR